MTASEIVVVGQIARDLVLAVDEVLEPGGTVDVLRRRELLGGKGANIAVGLAQLGAPVAVVRHPGGRPALDAGRVEKEADRISAR